MKRILNTLVITCVFVSMMGGASCRKDLHQRKLSGLHYLAYGTQKVLKIDQAIKVFDSTSLNDSVHYFFPYTDRIYKWKIEPDNSSVDLSGLYQNGVATMVFKKQGEYSISALIFDSATNEQIGQTDTLSVSVINDTLMHIQPVALNEKVHMEPALLRSAYDENGEKVLVLLLNFTTEGSYQYPSLSYLNYSEQVGDSIDIIFSNSLVLSSYPFLPDFISLTSSPNLTQIIIYGFKLDSAMPLSVTWKGRKYSGAITVTQSHTVHINWDNSGDVKSSGIEYKL